MEKRFCDRCEKEIDEKKGYLVVENKQKIVQGSAEAVSFNIPKERTLEFCSIKCLNLWSEEELKK